MDQQYNKRFLLWEIIKTGKLGDLFEVVSSFDESLVGEVIEVGGNGGANKTYTVIGKEFCNILESQLSSAIYKKISPYKAITFEEAVAILKKEGGMVYTKDAVTGEFEKFTQYKVLFGYPRLKDLMDTEFYSYVGKKTNNYSVWGF